MQVTDRQERVMELSTNVDLLAAIEELQKKKEMQEAIISQSFEGIKDDLKPKNIAKSLYHKVTDGEDALSLGLKVGGTIAAAIISKKIISNIGREDDVEEIKKEEKEKTTFAGQLLKTTATNFLLSNIPAIKTYVVAAYDNLFGDEETRLFHRIESKK